MDRRDEFSWPLYLAIHLWGASLIVLLCTDAFAWSLRDGLGPDAVESHGLQALGRFWRDMR